MGEYEMLIQTLQQLNANVKNMGSGGGSAVNPSVALLQAGILTRPQQDPKQALSALHTFTSVQTPQQIYNNSIGGSYGALLASLSISVDAVFQTNYQWQYTIDGVTPPNPAFEDFDPTVNVIDLVPTGKFFYVRPGGGIKINVFNSVSGNTTNGIFSILPTWHLLDYGTGTLIQKYLSGSAMGEF